jgi:hypothetical protein
LRAALEANGVEFTNGDQPGVRRRKDFLRVVGRAPQRRPFRDGDRVRYRPGKGPAERLAENPGAIGVVSWVEPYPIRGGPMPLIRVAFDDYETPQVSQGDFDFALD